MVTRSSVHKMVNVFLREQVVLPAVREVMVQSRLKKPPLDPFNFSGFSPFFNLSFLGKIVTKMVKLLLQKTPEEIYYRDYFKSSFKRGHNTEVAFIMLFDG